MPSFSYQSINNDGTVSEGVIEARSEHEVELLLKNKNVVPLQIQEVKQGFGKEQFSFRSVKSELQLFTTELHTLMSAGLPLDRSLNILHSITQNKKMKDIIFDILKSIREGGTFSDALQKHPRIFSTLYVNMVKAGEMSGSLEIVLEKLIEFLEASEELKNHIFSAMIYPVILVITGILSIIVMVTVVLPKFTQIFKDLGTQLPFSTQVLAGFSQFLLTFWWVILLAVAIVWIMIKAYLKTDKGRYNGDKLKLKLLGDIILKLETARFCRTLGALLHSGVPLLLAVKNAREIISNFVVSSSLDQVTKQIKEGKGGLQTILRRQHFPGAGYVYD